jgi:hypothetical protein
MKRKNIIIGFLSLTAAGIISATLVYQFVINKPHVNYEKAKPAYIVSAADLYNSFKSDRQGAESKFNGQVVLLNGKLDKVEVTDSLVTGVFVFEQGLFGDEGIRCSMLTDQVNRLETMPEGCQVMVKGYLTGYNETDVILEQCSIIR